MLHTPHREEIMHDFDKSYDINHKIQEYMYKELEVVNNLLLKNSSSSLKSHRISQLCENNTKNQNLQQKSMETLIAGLK